MNGRFPSLSIPVAPPVAPMEAEAADVLPGGPGWQYEPKWDGFRCIAFRDGRTVVLQSKAGEPLTRYFPEVVMAVASLPHMRFAVDGEIVVFGSGGRIRYDELLQRIHPSARRVAQLSAKTPATFLVFDLLAEEDTSLLDHPLSDRRKRLEKFWKTVDGSGVHLSPATSKKTEALGWLRDLGGAGTDGLMAKRKDAPYVPGGREGMVKMKVERTCDCVVAGVRQTPEGVITALLLGLYDEADLLHFVGATDTLSDEKRLELEPVLRPLALENGATSYTGRQPDFRTPTVAATSGARPRETVLLRPVLACEVRYDRFADDHFRTAPAFMRLRPDKKPKQCAFDQVRPPAAHGHGFELIGL